MVAEPTYLSPTPADVDISTAHKGAAMLGLPLFSQGETVARVLEARDDEGGALYQDVVIQLPRRATKTTAIWAVLIGRAETRPGYKCVTTAQSGTVASKILLEHGNALVANGHAVYSSESRQHPDKAVLYRNGGREHIDFPNGSTIMVVPPDAGAVRSAAADDVVVDEGGEHVGEKSLEFLNAVRPLQDTRGALAQLIVAGTPGKVRTGLFWEMLQEARNPVPDEDGWLDEVGIVDYSIRDDEDPEDRGVWRRVHPGPSSLKPDGSMLTPMRTLEKRRHKMGAQWFSREYLCLWPTDAATGALDIARWKAGGLDTFPVERPSRSVIAFDAPREQTSCAVVEVWRDDLGRACFELLAFRPGVSWAAAFIHRVAREAGVPVVFDEIGGNVTIANELRRKRPGVQVVPLRTLHVGGAAQLMATEVREGRILHFNQPDLTSAVDSVSWRPLGRDGRAFGHRPGKGEISPIVAASFGLWQFDQTPERRALAIRTSGRAS